MSGDQKNNDHSSLSSGVSAACSHTLLTTMNRLRSDAPARRSPRQLWWGALFVSSLTAMGSTFEAVRVSQFRCGVWKSCTCRFSSQRYSSVSIHEIADTTIIQPSNHWPNTHTKMGSIICHSNFPLNIPDCHCTKAATYIQQSEWN